ncbi:MAG: DUF1828 domain-containing protein [Alphaproteobacteria bacterium]
MNTEMLCKAFCDELLVRDVPAGLAVSTGYDWMGEPLGFYVVGPDDSGRYRVEDDGNTMPLIEAAVSDLDTPTRAEALESMLSEYGARYDEDRGELTTLPLREEQIPKAAISFVGLLLRLQDLILLTPERAASTFREDASNAIRVAIGDQAAIRENEPISPSIEFPADMIIEAAGHVPVAIYLAMSEQRVLEAVVAQMAALYEAQTPCSVIALLEKDTSVSRKMLRYAANRLVALPIFEGDQKAAIQRIEREVKGQSRTVH